MFISKYELNHLLAMNELYKESKIEVVKTINQNAFKIKIL